MSVLSVGKHFVSFALRVVYGVKFVYSWPVDIFVLLLETFEAVVGVHFVVSVLDRLEHFGLPLSFGLYVVSDILFVGLINLFGAYGLIKLVDFRFSDEISVS